MMKFKKGSIVEVLSKGSWFSAEIISGNGHYYNVKYNCPLGAFSNTNVERVSRKSIRPCPLKLCPESSCFVGDVVEAFDDYSWKTVVVSKILRDDFYIVSLLGSSREFKVQKFSIRVPQLWQDGKWIVTEKVTKTGDDVKLKRSSSLNVKRKFQAKGDHLGVQSKIGLPESRIVSPRTLKRASPYCDSHVDISNGHVEKMRAIEEEGIRQRFAQPPLLRKVDNRGEKYMNASTKKRTTEYHEIGSGKSNFLGNMESNESDTDSVGSCSIHEVIISYDHEIDTSYSDAESFSDRKNEEEEDLEATIHRLELDAYRNTLKALYVSGPLSWKLETLLTDLRISLHITNDEHLIELKTLVSTKTSSRIS